MNVNVGNVSSGSPKELPAHPAGEYRKRAARGTDSAFVSESRTSKALNPVASGLEDLRGRILVLQREVAKAQRVLGGLEGLEALLEAPAADQPTGGAVREYVSGVRYRNQPVLAGMGEQLERIVREGDAPGLKALIAESRGHLGLLAQELSRYETAQQNSRALAADGRSLQSLKQGIREAGGRLLEVQRENILRLLG